MLCIFFDFILEKPATRPRDRCGKEQLVYPFVTGSPGSSRVSALAPYSSGDRVGSTLSTPHAGGDLGLFVGECSSPQTDAPKQRRGMSHQRPDLSSHSSCDDPRLKFRIIRIIFRLGGPRVFLLPAVGFFACIFPLDFSDQYLYEAGKPMK